MFCPKCGGGDQSSESYCRNCGGWLADPDVGSTMGLFRKSTREEKIRKMRMLGLIGIGLSLTSAGVLVAFLTGSMDRGILFLALACSMIVAVYQAATMYLGYRVTNPASARSASPTTAAENVPIIEIRGGPTRQLNVPASVVENTTDLLDAIPVSRDSQNK